MPALCFNLMAAEEEGGGGVTVFQRSLTLLPGEMESVLSPLRASVNDGVLPCHRCVFILNGLTGRRSDRR